MPSKLRIGVLMGGLSIEREVSFSSGRTVCDHLDPELYDVIPVFQTSKNHLFILPWRFLHRGKISDFEERLTTEAEEIKWDSLKECIDFMFLAQHGRYAEDGAVQGFLEVLGIPYLGSKILGSALGMDKILQKEFLKGHRITVPRDIVIYPQELCDYEHDQQKLYARLEKNNLSFPLVIKPAQEGSSLGISVVLKKEDLLAALQKASSITPELTQPVLIEERIEGMEFTCVTMVDPITQEPFFFPLTEILYEPGFYLHGYEQKYMPGRSLKFTPARCDQNATQAIYDTCLKVMKILDFSTLGRIDGFLKEDGSVVIIDPNTLSGLAPSGFFFTQAAQIGMSHTDVINYLIKNELKGYAMNQDFSNETASAHTLTQKIKIGVLLGGPSNEKETSLNSGRNICYKLSPQKYEVVPLFVDTKTELYPLTQQLIVLNATAEIEGKLDRTTKINWHDLPQLVDFVFIGLHGGPGENGAIQGTLEMLGIPYNGPGITASALCMDKYKANAFLHTQGFDVPDSLLVSKHEWLLDSDALAEKCITQLSLPAIVKPHDDGCSVMVQKAKTKEDLVAAVNAVFTQGKNCVMVEECIIGTELTVGVIGNENPQALPPSQVFSSGDILSMEEKFLPGAGENQTPALLPKEVIARVQKTMEQVFTTVGCSGYSRIDCFYQTAAQSKTGKERIITLEINTLPGLTPATCIFHQAAEVGIKPMDFIDLLVTLGFEKHTKTQPEVTTILKTHNIFPSLEKTVY
jgi:UDP-N-acetylmuramate--alanine ligase